MYTRRNVLKIISVISLIAIKGRAEALPLLASLVMRTSLTKSLSFIGKVLLARYINLALKPHKEALIERIEDIIIENIENVENSDYGIAPKDKPHIINYWNDNPKEYGHFKTCQICNKAALQITYNTPLQYEVPRLVSNIYTDNRENNNPRNNGQPYDFYDIQTDLKELGYNPGVIDGIMGPRTRRALSDFKFENCPPREKEYDIIRNLCKY